MSNAYQFARTGFNSFWKKISRGIFRLLILFHSKERKIAAERWFRGREQVRKLKGAEVVVVSFGKSGRTWLRMMLSRAYQQMFALPELSLLAYDNFHRMNGSIPRIFFTHDNYIKDYTGHKDSKVEFYNKKVVLLARDPRDIAVSQFFQWKHRMKPNKIVINWYPEGEKDLAVFDFVMHPHAGLPNIIHFMNLWAGEADRVTDFFLLRYEDLRAKPEETLDALLRFLGTPAGDDTIRDAVEYSSYDNMKKMEQGKKFWLSGGRMKPADRANPESYKVRRAKVGGYRDYFDEQQVQQIESLVASTLSPFYGYGAATAADESDSDSRSG